jgi:exodeoxyribonuclease V beta subunit
VRRERTSREAAAASAASQLDPTAVPLNGLTLIEANAGTGKTWTITALYVRLLLEAERGVDAILVVTFTEMATAELRDRIRRRLGEVRAAFESGAAGADALMAALLARVDREVALLRLTAALRDFDQAPIYTIHGFCQRVLAERAFESGGAFRTEILPDESLILQEVVDDFWRTEMHAASALYARFLLGKRVDPDALLKAVASHIGRPYLLVRAPERDANCAERERVYVEAWMHARAIWLAERDAIAQRLIGSTHLHGGWYRRASIPGWLAEIHACLSPASATLDLCERFEKFTPEALARGTKKGMRPPEHAFFEACRTLTQAHEALMTAYQRELPNLKARLLDYARGELATRKARRQLRSYDDLLLNLDRALRADGGDALADALRTRYSAALIDEFQDTDPIQYGIFSRIYGGTGLPVFLVGDPKQAIYSFRGADVYAYLEARRDARATHTLDTNWRSAPQLLGAVNLLFERARLPFVLDGIPFNPSQPAAGERGRFAVEGESGAPLEVWLIESADTPMSKNAAAECAARATAGEIARLLMLGARGAARVVESDGRERPLIGGDIAVLVRTHRQARTVREALGALGVACVQRGSDNVFHSPEAGELERVLLAIAEPGREALVSGALATELLGLTGEDLHALRGDEPRWEAVVEGFREAHREWREHGFARMLRAFLQRNDVMPRLLAYADGERRVTNLLHLAELLHCESEAEGIADLLAWLAAKRNLAGAGVEAELLRLESDENLVKILTVHIAKGLEFPLVFCPCAWDGGLRSARAEAVTFHDPAHGERAVLDLGSEGFDFARLCATREELAESVRLLYVALTRARYRCWMVWGNVKEANTAAPAWLLHAPVDIDASAGTFDASTLPALGDARIRADLERLAADSGGAIRVSPLPEAATSRFEPFAVSAPALSARKFTGALRDTRRVTSFSALAHGRAVEAPDFDSVEVESPVEATPAGRDIHAFPRGAQAGRCLHAIFEQVDFADASPVDVERVAAKELTAHGFESGWTRVVADTVQSVAATPLDESGMRLSGVERSKRLDELEFYYPVAGLADAPLKRMLLAGGFPDEIRERIGSLTFAPAQGYMRGFIDLVFEHDGRYYLADYKSNWLGPSVRHYRQDALAKAMAREAYYLQYLVYCVALHRYLGSRVRGYRFEAHFGGVRYLFLRGMRPDTGPACGVYADRPEEALIRTLDDFLRTGHVSPVPRKVRVEPS